MQSYPPFQAQAQPNQQFQRQAFQPVIAFQSQTSVNPSGFWMPAPVVVPICPPGLEYLIQVDQLLIKREPTGLGETGLENHKYTIKNAIGQDVYRIIEKNDFSIRKCFGSDQRINMDVLDAYGNHAIHMSRPIQCESCCFPSCLQKMEVSSPPGQAIGTIDQEWSFLTPRYSIKNQSGETVFRIEGPVCAFTCFADVNFKILTLDGTQIGQISKHWNGLFSDARSFGIIFPVDLDAKLKALLLSTCCLVDRMYFENND